MISILEVDPRETGTPSAPLLSAVARLKAKAEEIVARREQIARENEAIQARRLQMGDFLVVADASATTNSANSVEHQRLEDERKLNAFITSVTAIAQSAFGVCVIFHAN
jgi:hypothetical protein